MIKFIKPILFFLSLSLVTILTNGQQLIRVNEDIEEKFKKYCEALPREEIYIHTDRDDYIAGEEIWFNAYLVDRAAAKPSDGSKIVYFELLNPDNRPVVQKRIKIEEGFGPGMVIIPDTSSTGEYTLRAYTNWMKNFLPENCFLKELRIYNVLSTRRLAGTGNKIPAGSDLKDQRVITQSGFDADINKSDTGMLEIIIRTNREFRSSNRNLCYIFIHTHGVIDINKSEYLTGDTTTISIPEKSLTQGINHITLFNSREEPLFERFVYTPSDHNRFLTLNSPVSAGTRNKILIEIEPDRKYIHSSENLNLSISVAPQTGRQKVPDITDYMIFGSEFDILPDEIRKHRISELPAEAVDRFLRTAKSNWIDWRVILSGKLPDLKHKMEKENHFLSGTLVNRVSRDQDSARYVFLSTPGKVAGFQYSKTDKDGNFSFNIPINQEVRDIIIQPEEVDRNNTVKIESSFSEEYLLRVNQSGLIEQEAPPDVSKKGINYQVWKIYETSSIGDTFAQISSIPEVKKFYGKPDVELIMDDYIKLPVMQEVFFELMPGVFLRSRKSKWEITIADPVENKIFQKPPVLFIDGVVINDPAIIANLDPEIVEKIDAVKEKYFVGYYLFYGLVNVITRAGDYSCVNLPDYAVRLPYRVIDPVSSFSTPDYSTKEMKESRIPDYRNTLYWNPSVKPGDDGKIRIELWTSDYVSDYEINIQGLSEDGKTLSYSKGFRIGQ